MDIIPLGYGDYDEWFSLEGLFLFTSIVWLSIFWFWLWLWCDL